MNSHRAARLLRIAINRLCGWTVQETFHFH
jgi:hypothetical protein